MFVIKRCIQRVPTPGQLSSLMTNTLGEACELQRTVGGRNMQAWIRLGALRAPILNFYYCEIFAILSKVLQAQNVGHLRPLVRSCRKYKGMFLYNALSSPSANLFIPMASFFLYLDSMTILFNLVQS